MADVPTEYLIEVRGKNGQLKHQRIAHSWDDVAAWADEFHNRYYEGEPNVQVHISPVEVIQ